MYDTPAKPACCDTPTPANRKTEYKKFDDIYFIKLAFDANNNNIIILCYNTTELEEDKRYEVKISKLDFEQMDKIFKTFDNLEEIYELMIPIIESNKYKINYLSDEDKMSIDLYFNIDFKNNNFDLTINFDMKANTEGDFSDDFNYILRNEIIKLKKKYKKEIYDLKNQNKAIINELNGIKKVIYNMCHKNQQKPAQSTKSNNQEIKILNLKGKKLDVNALKSLVNYPYLEKLDISQNNITNISMLDKCRFKELKYFNISNNKINDITVLKEFKFQKLEELYLNQNNICNLEPLTKMDLTHVLRINLSNNNIADLNAFNRISAPKLQYLNLSHNSIEDIQVFGTVEFKDLKELYLDNNKIDDEINFYIINDLKSKITKFTYK